MTPSLTGYTFSPTSQAVTVNGANVTVPNFTATAQTWSITGSVGTSGSGATINLTGASTATTPANSSGAYTFSGLTNGSYTVTPSIAGYTFSPDKSGGDRQWGECDGAELYGNGADLEHYGQRRNVR